MKGNLGFRLLRCLGYITNSPGLQLLWKNLAYLSDVNCNVLASIA